MEKEYQLTEKISKLYNASIEKLNYDNANVTINDLVSIEDNIKQLTIIQKDLDNILSDLKNKIKTLNIKHTNNIKLVENIISRRVQIWNKDRTHSLVIDNVTEKKDSNPKSKIQINDQYSLDAYKIPDWHHIDCIQSGELYYVESCNQFAIRLNGELFYGNIGNIYSAKKDPILVKKCNFGPKCINSECKYFHDPFEQFKAGSTEHLDNVRNYISGSFLYVGGLQAKDGFRYRHFGSRENISQDMILYDYGEVEKYKFQVMHDILCSLLLMKYKK